MNIQNFHSKIRDEEKRNDRFLHLTPNEPYMSDTARSFMSSKLDDRYYFGEGEDGVIDGGAFTGLAHPGIANLVTEAENATKEMLGASIVNLNCLSGVHAMMCAILSTTEPNEAVMSVHHDHGGHFATEGIIKRIGRKHLLTPSFDNEGLKFDAEEIAKSCKENDVKAFYMDVSYYLNPHNLKELREAISSETIIIYDASHTMGLILGQQFQKPFAEGADVVCANTHKTLPGPQKGMIAFKEGDLGERANDIINSSLYSSPHTASMIALATALLEMKEFGEDYAKQIIANSNALGTALENLGHDVRKSNTGRFSENHQVHLMTGGIGNYLDLYKKFMSNSITLAFDHPDVFMGGSFIRLGTQEITRRGMKEDDMTKIAEFLDRSLKGESIGNEVESFIDGFRKAHYSFDAV